MKKVLIIGYFWPYIGGSKRIFGLAQFLPDFGWQPIIITGPLGQKPDPKFRVIETEYCCFLAPWAKFFGFNQKIDLSDQLQTRARNTPSALKSLLVFFYNRVKTIAAYPDEHRGWQSFALKAAWQLCQKEKIAGLISVYPVVSHIIAKKIKEKYQIPWIADLPDLWSDNEAYTYGPIRKIFDKHLEVKTLASADAITTSSSVYRQELKQLHHKKETHLITLGFAPQTFNRPPAPLTKKFSITYTGIFYPRKRTPTKFIQALAELIRENIINPQDIEVRFYAPANEQVAQQIKKYQLTAVVKQPGFVPFEACLKKQRESQLLLQLNWENKRAGRAFSGKIFDYLAAQRPILAAGGQDNDVVKKLIITTGAGVYCPSLATIKKALSQYYWEYKKNGQVSYQGNWQKIKRYSSQAAAQKYALLLNKLT